MPRKFFVYSTVPPSDLGGEFPTVLGYTVAADVGDVVLRTVDTGDQFTLACDHIQYDPDAHLSTGITEGFHKIGVAIRKNRRWSGTITEYIDGRKHFEWQTSEPGDGVYDLRIFIGAPAAHQIEALEQEHVGDFTLAWNCTFDVMDWAIARLTPENSTGQAIGQLVGILQDGYRYLIPEDPHDLDSWGQRLKHVYRTLCDHSGKRDEGEHSPAGYFLNLMPDNSIAIQFSFNDLHPDSNAYVRTDEIEVVYKASGFDPVSARAAAIQDTPLANGTSVTWRDPEIWFAEGIDKEAEFYFLPDLEDAHFTDTTGIRKGIAASAVVSRQGADGYVWVKTVIENGERYVYVRSYLLTPK